MEPVWKRDAEVLLGQRDRFTQRRVREDFRDKCLSNDVPDASLVFDPEHGGYLTPVADDRYSVIWYLEDNVPAVEAVIATTRFDQSMTDLKERVVKAVERESDGTVTLKK